MFGLEPDISAGWSGNDNKKRKQENDNIIFLMLDFNIGAFFISG